MISSRPPKAARALSPSTVSERESARARERERERGRERKREGENSVYFSER